MMEVFAGFLEHTDHHIGRLIDYLRRRRTRQHADHADLGQWRELGRRTDRLDQRKQVLQQRPGRSEGKSRGARRSRRAQIFQPLPLGLDVRRQHAVQALEARDFRGGVSDPFLVHWPKGIKAKGESAINTRMRSTWCRPCSRRSASSRRRNSRRHAIADRGVSFAHSSMSEAPTKHHTQYFEMFAHRAIYHDGWRAVCPLPGPSFTEAKAFFGELDSPRTSCASSMPRGGNSITSWTIRPRPGTLPDQPRQADRNDRAMVRRGGKYNVLPLDSRGTARFADERPQLTKERQVYVYFRVPRPCRKTLP